MEGGGWNMAQPPRGIVKTGSDSPTKQKQPFINRPQGQVTGQKPLSHWVYLLTNEWGPWMFPLLPGAPPSPFGLSESPHTKTPYPLLCFCGTLFHHPNSLHFFHFGLDRRAESDKDSGLGAHLT